MRLPFALAAAAVLWSVPWLARADDALPDAGACDPDAGPCAPPTPKQIYDSKCAGCHGLDAKGKTKYGIKHRIPNFATKKWQASISDAEIGKTIREGVTEKGKKLMPAFKGKLTPDEVVALTLYLRSFGP